MFAKIVQKWNALKAEWKEYQKLRRVVSRAWHKLDAVRGKITVLYNIGDAQEIKSCIRRKFVSAPTSSFGQDDLNLGVCRDIMPYDSYCPYFKGDSRGEDVASCAQTDCPCYAKNCEYVAAAHELEIARAKRDAFWGDKSNTKSK